MLINSPRAHIARQFKITGLEVLVMFIGRYYNPDLITANTRREHIRVGIMGTADLFHTKRRYVQAGSTKTACRRTGWTRRWRSSVPTASPLPATNWCRPGR